MAPTADDNYVVISADCHGGADVRAYRPYLEAKYHDEFDTWLETFVNPFDFDDLKAEVAYRNWDSGRRLAEMEADGVVAEVIFPNTIPPFFDVTSLLGSAANPNDRDRQWAGLRAHNRWLADFCDDAPGRRAGIIQIALHDVAGSVDEISWAAERGLTGGVLLPGAPPGSGLAPIYAPEYEPIWAACAEAGMPITHHSGSAVPDFGKYPASKAIFLIEVTWWAHRTLWHLMFSGVMERHPDLQFVFTEQGTAWVTEELTRLDYYWLRLRGAGGSEGSQEAQFGAAVRELSLRPSEYWARQCQLGSSFIRRNEVPARSVVGVDKIMWGTDFPHLEGCWPYTREHLRLAFADVDVDEVRAMVGANAARVYGFDLAELQPLADKFGPSPAEVAVPLEPGDIPAESLRCPAFAAAKFGK